MLNVIVAISLLWVTLANPLSVVARDSSPAVLDTSGRPLKSGTGYYILPNGTNGGGATLVDRNGSCPLFVGQENTVGSAGLPVLFTPFGNGETTVREDRDFTIVFDAATICVQSTQWALESHPASSERTLITTAGTAVYLRISRDGNAYKLSFCPTDVCPLCRFRCGDVGVYVENGKRLLAVYAPALPVVFRRA